MKKILFVAFLALSVSAFSQTPDTKPRIKITMPPTQDTPVQATHQPLLVVDGVIISKFKDDKAFQDKLKEIKPEDIQSIDVLKDEKAVEKYGEQGLHGVIVVTMKKK
jgi:TonB-dependent Receptor Plug Domain